MVITVPKKIFESLLEGRDEALKAFGRAILPKGEIAPGREYALYASPWEAYKAYALAEEAERLLGRKVKVRIR